MHILLSGDARRNRDDFLDIILSKSSVHTKLIAGFPFQHEVNTGYGILTKTYLDAAIYHYGDSIAPDAATESSAVEAKKAALSFVGDTFSSVKSPQTEVERGFRFWDAVSVADLESAMLISGRGWCAQIGARARAKPVTSQLSNKSRGH